jgi:hypothetical protein
LRPLFTNSANRDHLEFKKAFFAKRRPLFNDVLARDAPRTYPWWNELSVQTKANMKGANSSEPSKL